MSSATPIRLAPGVELPVEVVTQAVAILAKRRAGKSYLARRLAEEIDNAGQQLIILDPKGDWWGIRSTADGKGKGVALVIFGGERGDVPIHAGAGDAVARAIVERRVSALIDLSLFRKHELATFCAGFLESLYRLKALEANRTPAMVIIDEADAVAPQKPQQNELRMLGAASDIVRRGGQRGIGCVLVTQRSAVLSKDVLTQVELLITLRTIGPQDLKAIREWIDVHGTPQQGKELIQSLPSLPQGVAWFWSPGWPTASGLFVCGKVHSIRTFDSGATPAAGEARFEPRVFAKADVEEILHQLAAEIDRAEADNPTKLRRRIAELESQLRAIPNQSSMEQVKSQAYEAGVDRGKTLIRNAVIRAMDEMPSGAVSDASFMKPSAPLVSATTAKPSKKGTEATSDRTLGRAHRSILTALNQHGEMTIRKLALLTGYASNGGGFRNALGALRTSGYIVSNGGLIECTESGAKALGDFEPLPSSATELLAHWKANLGKAEREILDVLSVGHQMSIEDIANATPSQYAPNGGGFRNAIGRLRTLNLIQGSKQISIAEELQ